MFVFGQVLAPCDFFLAHRSFGSYLGSLMTIMLCISSLVLHSPHFAKLLKMCGLECCGCALGLQ